MRNNKQKGLSLIELLIVVAIILIIAAIPIPNLLRSKMAANEASAVASLRTLNTVIVEYQTTYATGFLPHIQDDGRIRGRLNQRGTVTGRFSSSGPNLQNIPRQGDEEESANKIRSMFMAPSGFVLVPEEVPLIRMETLVRTIPL